MAELIKPTVDASDLGALEKQLPHEETFATFDEYEKHQKAIEKEIIGNYVMGDIIGKGGFATVCKGLNLSTGEVVAVKKFERSKISSQQISSVMYEVELLQRLTHDNIVHILGKAESDRHLYIFMEFMENGSLRGLLQSFGAFPEQLVAQFMEQVLHGLIYLHDAGVVHRDIKAANILLNRSGVKLADFGVAAELNENDRRYSVVGTPYWMAPEVIEITGHSLASDIWSVGCTVIEMVTGKPPYFHLNPMSAMFRIVQDPFPPLPKGISKDLESFLKSCFQKEPEHRLSARELLVHPWITHRLTNSPVPSTHEAIRHSVTLMMNGGKSYAYENGHAQGGRRGSGSDESSRENTIVHLRGGDTSSREDTIVHREPRESRVRFDSVSSDSTTTSVPPPLSRSSSFMTDTPTTDTRENSFSECGDCARLHRLLAEEKTKRQEILLTAINYIASSDAARAGEEAEPQREFRESLRTMLEEEFKLAFPDDNMPRFMQRRLTICNDQLPQIPPQPASPSTPDKKDTPRSSDKNKKQELRDKEKKEKEEKERKEKEKKEREKREKEMKKKEKDKDSFTSSKEKKDLAMKELKEKKELALKERRDMLAKEKEKKPADKSWFSARRKPSNTSSTNLTLGVPATADGD